MHNNPTSFPSRPHQLVSGPYPPTSAFNNLALRPSTSDAPRHPDGLLVHHRFKPNNNNNNDNNKNDLLKKIIPDIQETGKLLSYAKTLDMLMENAKDNGDYHDWDELEKKSREAWAEIKQRNKQQKEELEGIIGLAVRDQMDFHSSQQSRTAEEDDHNNDEWHQLGKTEFE